MAKAILKYDLSDPDDAVEYRTASKARDMSSVLWDFDQWLRQLHKYGVSELSVDWPEAIDGRTLDQKEILERIKEDCAFAIRSRLLALLSEAGVELE